MHQVHKLVNLILDYLTLLLNVIIAYRFGPAFERAKLLIAYRMMKCLIQRKKEDGDMRGVKLKTWTNQVPGFL